ncbi:hypothetical protein PIB30_062979 [Stylosanthes scabra]|uniref:Uncharacterized protein n=1 Tax=Stylosanthes scabra TaxID=79078 RepID=A0ABU6YIT0_9FABA|nr:hypothetical protein [Stylosanthes scabra]
MLGGRRTAKPSHSQVVLWLLGTVSLLVKSVSVAVTEFSQGLVAAKLFSPLYVLAGGCCRLVPVIIAAGNWLSELLLYFSRVTANCSWMY